MAVEPVKVMEHLLIFWEVWRSEIKKANEATLVYNQAWILKPSGAVILCFSFKLIWFSSESKYFEYYDVIHIQTHPRTTKWLGLVLDSRRYISMLSCVQHDKKPCLKELIPTCEKDTDREGFHFSRGCRGLHSLPKSHIKVQVIIVLCEKGYIHSFSDFYSSASRLWSEWLLFCL